MLAEAREPCSQAAADHGCEVELEHLWSIPPIPFDDRLIGSRASPWSTRAANTAIPSGPLHDAAEMARLIPTVMIFSSSLAAGLAHEGGGHARGGPAGGDRRLRPHGAGHARARRRDDSRARVSALGAPPTSGSSGFYASKLRGIREQVRGRRPPRLATTKDGLREGQRREPPFGPAPVRAGGAARAHARDLGHDRRSVAVGFTRRDHEENSAVGGEAFRIAGLRADDVVAHCLNYALYAGGIADHMALEASGATVVPVGTGQSRRLLELIPRLGITAIFGTLSFPATSPSGRARRASSPQALGLRRIVTAGEPGAGAGAVRAEIEGTGALAGRHVRDERRLVHDGRRLRCGRGPPPHRGAPCSSGRRRTAASRSSSRTARAASSCGRTCAARPRRFCATARAILRACGPRPARVGAARRGSGSTPAATTCCGAGRERLPAGDRRDPRRRARLGRHCVVAEGDPVRPPLELYVEAPPDRPHGLAERLRARSAALRRPRLEPGSLPVAEHKTRIVHRTARGDILPPAVEGPQQPA